MKQERSWHEVVADCQERVTRIRAALINDGVMTPEIMADRDAVILTMRNWILGQARKLAGFDDDMVGEALLKTIVQFNRDLHSPGYTSMERKFGAYIKTTVNRVLFEIRGNVQEHSALYKSESLNATIGEDGLERSELIEDTAPEALAEEYREEQLRTRLYAAIAQLPHFDREVITMKLDGVLGVEIARKLNMSPVNISRIYNRVVEQLRQMLATEEA